ncbi:anion permease [Propionibacterium freudenreichii]|uniref:DASS family sodium-coupled anion symporter n=1 Tax=Propionibacterium freudenreichii TaxID=1744 RepID=UPI0005423358|nr:DASS family sodium-coupled anion symporter [Propionibacterium freudenreichii]WBF59924.1 anion permease [Propionibacterium freudenreichii]WBF63605.1 anion permease [Propionibacterium freudenreichii]CEH10228.1 divalent anion:Na+ symporter 2.A.47.3.x [Propionibacterium freudenreichii]SBW75915.1 CitT protein [Propionibacterium freudenreichii]
MTTHDNNSTASTIQEKPTKAPPLAPVRVKIFFDWKRALIPVIIGPGMFLIPTPGGLEPRAWHMLALFVATIVAIIAKVMPMGAVCLVALTISGLFGLTPVVPGKGDVGMLSGFANSTIWLIGIAMLLSRAVIKTGLGRRVALFFISVFGKKMIGVAYGFALADLVLGPGIPSASARGGGIMYPIMQSVATAYGSEPGPSARKAGSFLAIAISQIDTIVCAMFLTAMAGNPIMASLAGDLGVHMSWTSWFVGAIVPGLVALIALPYFLYKIYPPEIKDSPEIAAFARGELKDMGPMSRAEKVLTADFVLLLLLWIVGDMAFGINATVSAFIGLAILMVTSIMTWEDIIKEKAAWNTIFWFAVLVMMAGALNTYGVVGWIAKGIARGVGGIGWHMGLVVLILVFFYTRYFFASAVAHISAMYAAFLATALALGAPPMLAAMSLAYTALLSMGLTQYSGGPGPALFGSGYNSTGRWWGVSFLCSIPSLLIWFVVGGAWFKVIGWW